MNSSKSHTSLRFGRGSRVLVCGVSAVLGAALIVGPTGSPVFASNPPVVDLLTQANIAFNGAGTSTQTGFSVAGAGDVNGDGFDDVIIGVPSAQPNGSNSGSSYVLFGGATQTTSVDLATLTSSQGFRIDGAASADKSGRTVAGAGDVNNDGFDDVIIGALGAGSGSRASAGVSYVVFGSASPTNINLASPGSGWGFEIDGAAKSDKSGQSVSGAGDVNGDGYADVVIGAANADPNGSDSGASYVVFGGTSTATRNLASLNSSTGFRIDGAAAADELGQSVSAAGDVNGDGLADVIVGAPNADKNGRTDSGSSYVVFGSGSPANINLAAPPTGWGFEIDGAAAGDNLGSAVSGAGDVDGDGLDDMIVGAPSAQPNGSNSGSSYVLFGSASQSTSVDLASLTASQGFRIDGVSGSKSGRTVAGVGDLNGDGKADVVVGAPLATNNGYVSGSSYVVLGSSQITAPVDLSGLTVVQGFRIDGVGGTQSGFSVAGAGDVNGDGKPDVIVGAPAGSVTASYVVYGPPSQVLNVAASPGQVQATVSWQIPVSSGSTSLTGYRVQVATAPIGPFSDAAGGCAPSATASSLATSCIATGLSSSQTYYFRVAANNTVGQGPASSVSGGVTPTPTVPGFTAGTDPFVFGSVVVGQNSTLTETISNDGSGDVVIGAVTVADTTNYSVAAAGVDNTCANQTIAPAGTCDVKLTFTPKTAGTHNTVLSFADNVGSPDTVSVTGTATAPPAPPNNLPAVLVPECPGGSCAGADLSGLDLSGLDLSGIDFAGADLVDANLSRANLARANLARADLRFAKLIRADLRHANLTRANLSGQSGSASLSRLVVDVRGDVRKPRGANLTRANLTGATLTKAKMRGSVLKKAKLVRAGLRQANLSWSMARSANFNSADLRRANFRHADLENATFVHAKFAHTKF